MKRLVIVGGGFAGFWSAVSAVRQARALNANLQVTLVTRDGEQTNRPRLYESNLDGLRWRLADYCTPLGIALIVDEVTEIAPAERQVRLKHTAEPLPYDSLVLAAGSRVRRPDLPGISRAFDVDTYPAAKALEAHLATLAAAGFASAADRGVVIVGAGFTGLELATAMPDRLARMLPPGRSARVVLVERAGALPFAIADAGADYIHQRLTDSGVELHLGRSVQAIGEAQVTLDDGTEIPARTVVWAGGLEASPLTRAFPGPLDGSGRLIVNQDLSLPSHPEVFVAGDAASATPVVGHTAPMSCQHAMPQGRIAGHNAVNRLAGEALTPYSQPRYVTCLDLGPGHALFTTGWEREVSRQGPEGKATKQRIVTELIVPPRDPQEALAASAPSAA